MPAINFPEYAQRITDILNKVTTTGEAVLIDHQIDQRASSLGFIAGTLQFENGNTLHFREFINTGQSEPRMMYAYHYQDMNSNLIFRYDNAAHKPALSQSEHKHTPAGIELSSAPTLIEILDKILKR